MGDTTLMALDAVKDSRRETLDQMAKPYKRTRRQLQIGMFILTYLSYGSIHCYREFWSLSKPVIEDNTGKYHSTKSLLSDVDTVNFMVYGLA